MNSVDTFDSAHVSRRAVASAPTVRFGQLVFHLLMTGLVAGGIVFERGFYHRPISPAAIHLGQVVLLGLYWLSVFYHAARERLAIPEQRVTWLDFAVLGLMVFGGTMHLGGVRPWGWELLELGAVMLLLAELWRFNVALSHVVKRPGILFPLSFVTLIAVGTILLKVPVAVPAGEHISWLNSLFTMTSAVCVTGLTVRNTATQFTPFGQTIICLFIQLGGLGILIFASTLALLLGRSLSLRQHLSLSSMLADQPLFKLNSFVRFIVVTTLVIEALGALAMIPLWHGSPGHPLTLEQRVELSAFHSVSAFCNAGFDITGNSLVGYRYSLLSHAVIGPLIVLGGLGFPVLSNLFQVAKSRVLRWAAHLMRRVPRDVDLARHRLSLHTKMVITTSVGLYLFGVVTIAAGQLMPYAYGWLDQGVTANQQRPGALTVDKVGGILADASFMSISARTAGFNTVKMDHIEPAGRFALMLLMVVGGSPGSTAGGVKTTVLALLLLSVVATLRPTREAQAFGRAISDSLVRKAATLATCYLGLVATATLLLCLSEPFPFDQILFEVISASSTVGLSLGITSHLTSFGELVIIAAMYLGRIGPLALLGTLIFRAAASRPYAFPHEDVALG